MHTAFQDPQALLNQVFHMYCIGRYVHTWLAGPAALCSFEPLVQVVLPSLPKDDKMLEYNSSAAQNATEMLYFLPSSIFGCL